jgi:hypothetical protein
LSHSDSPSPTTATAINSGSSNTAPQAWERT